MIALSSVLTAVALDLATVSGISSANLTVGRQPQQVQRVGLEVHVRPGPTRNEARGAGHQVQGHELEILVRQKQLREASQTGQAQVLAARPVAEAIAKLFAAGAPTNTAAVAGVIGSTAEIEREDTDPERLDVLEVAVRVVVLVNGEVVP